MDKSNVNQFDINGTVYDGQRVTWDGGTRGYIEFREPGGADPVARINYNGIGTPLEVCTYGNALPMPAVQKLVELAEWGLVESEDPHAPASAASG